MKKMFIMAVSLLMAITACNGNTSSSKETTETTTVTAKSETLVKHLNKTEFKTKVYDYEKNASKWVFEGKRPAIVDFYATWCGPCKMVAPILEELAKEYEGKIDVYKIDTDQERELSAAFGIRSIPTLLFIPVEGDPQIAQGALPKAELKKIIDDFMLGNK